RVTAVTGRGAVDAVQKLAGVVDDLTAALGCKADEGPARVAGLLDEVKKLQTQLKKGAAAGLNSAATALLPSATEVNGVKSVVGEVPAAPVDQMRAQMDRLRNKATSAAILLGYVDEGKVGLMSAVTVDVEGKLPAGKWVGEVAPIVGGRGGGKSRLAQAGGSDPSK